MMIDTILANVDQQCVRKRGLGKEGCNISLNGAPQPRLIVDVDKLNFPYIENQTRCDYLFIAEPPGKPAWIVPIELKKGEPKVGNVKRQLQAGADIAASLVPRDIDVKFCPVVASGKGASKNQRLNLRNTLIHFRGKNEPVRRIRCSDSLHTVLE